MTKRALEQELRDLKALYRAMVDHAPEAIVIFDMDDGKFVEANPQACALFGKCREDLLEVGPADMSPEVQPDGTPSVVGARDMLERALSGEDQWFEWTHQNASGQPILCRVQLVHVPSGGRRLVRGSVLDISAGEKARQRLIALLDATPDIVGLADAQGRSEYMNPAGRELLGVPLDQDITTLPISAFHPPEWAERVEREVLPAAVRDGLWRGETQFQARSGEVIPVSQVVVAHRDARGNLEYLSTIARDIRDRLAAEELERKVLQAQKLESLGVLAGGIAHDFNNILVGVLTNASLGVRMAGEHHELRELLLDIQAAGMRAADLAHQMLDYAGKSQARIGPVHVEALAREVSHLVEASISKNTDLRFEFSDHVPPIAGDASQLRQVLMNLILNASESLENEPGVVLVRSAVSAPDRSSLLFDHLGEEPPNRLVLLEVTDRGRGIEGPVDRIFDPFFTTKFTGRGLGLAAVMGIVKAHRGAIQVESRSGTGTTFRLWFRPLDEAGAEQVSRVEAGPVEASRGRGTVLVVDDEDVVRRTLSHALTGMGFEVLEASSGATAEALFEAHHGDIAAVLVDLTMPGISGLDVIERLREFSRSPRVVLMSGYGEEHVDTSKADAFLQKPFTLSDVTDALEGVLR